MSNGMQRVVWRGKPMTARQRQACYEAEQNIRNDGHTQFRFTVMQGSWQKRSDYSGSSHTGAGVIDLGYMGMAYSSAAEMEFYRYVLRHLRDVKQAAFGRGPWTAYNGSTAMPLHFHVCDLYTEGEAQTVSGFQVPQYKMGYDGLWPGHADPFSYRPSNYRPWVYR